MHIMTSNRCYPFVSAFYALRLSEFYMDFHSHRGLEIMYVTKGTCTVFLKDRSVQLTQREFIFLDSQVSHRLLVTPDQPCSLLNLEFFCQEKENGQDLRELAAHCPDFVELCRSNQPYHMGMDTRNLGYALKDLISQMESKGEDDVYLRRLLFFRFLIELSKCIRTDGSTAGLTYLKKACRYIDEHMTEDIRVPDIATFAGVNKSYLQSLFRSRLDTTVTDYINKKRLEQAAFLLTNSTANVTDIGFACGYNSRQHFGYTFEKYYGCSPRAYRQLHRTSLTPSTGNAQHVIEEDGSVRREILAFDCTKYQGKGEVFPE